MRYAVFQTQLVKLYLPSFDGTLLIGRFIPDVPLTSLRANPKIVFDEALSHIQTDYTHRKKRDIVVICRQGNDSQVAASILRIALSDHDIDENVGDEVADPGKGKLIEEAKLNEFTIRDVRGGLRAWHELVDPQFPVY
jgi:rhodanese-related sulfurtransferase